MKFLLLAIALSTIIAVAYGAVAIILPDKTPGHPGHCYSNDIGPLDKAESKTIKNCVRASCNDDGSIDLASCGKISTLCDLTAPDLSKPYPDCCPQAKNC